ncbi:Exportin-T [Oopsacas minuta]|uniref:Exportin-T n=1 Tax=Oopsacas minuta TaxID=111878 RepID=A0AAV7KMK7_9METZ|nr:Exportin-T [Oopsacas minuta]
MDPNLSSLLSSPDTSNQSQVLIYFNQLLTAPNGWMLCADTIKESNTYDQHVIFFCLRILEEFSKTRYSQESADNKLFFRKLLLSWLEQSSSPQPSFILNKKCQIFIHVFLQDYPDYWPSFFSDILSYLTSYSHEPTQLYLHILLYMNDEVMDKSIPRSLEDQQRANLIKDNMREGCISQLVESWIQILIDSTSFTPETLCTTLRVVGLYTQWIDLPYIINSRFLDIFLQLLGKEETRISVVETFQGIVNKGMERSSKLKLIEMLTELLIRAGVFQTNNSDTDFDLDFELSKFLNLTGSQLVTACQSAVKENNQPTAAHPFLTSLHRVFSYICTMLQSEDDGVSENILPCVISYVSLFKSHRELLVEESYRNVMTLLLICFEKLKFDESHDFANEGENEVLFLDYRRELRVLFSTISLLLPQLVLSEVDKLLSHVIDRLTVLQYMDVEVVLYLIYLSDESIPWKHPQLGDELSNTWNMILNRLLDSSLALYPHEAVSYQFLENLVRFVPFIKANTGYLPLVLSSFLDERGVKNSNPRVRSRACFLLTRFLKDFKLSLKDISLDLLNGVLQVFDGGLIRDSQLGVEDLRFLYESAGTLIMFSSTPQGDKGSLIQSLLTPILDQFTLTFNTLHTQLLQLPQNHVPVPAGIVDLSRTLCNLMRLASFASKCVSSQQVAEETGCSHVFLHLLEHFSKILAIPMQQDTLQEGFRPFLHRMVIILGAEFLPFLPELLTRLLHVPTQTGPQECCILLNQIVAAHPNRTGPHLEQLLSPCITSVMTALSSMHKPDYDPNVLFDLVKSYLSLSHTLVHNSTLVEHLIQLPSSSLHSFLSSLIQILLSYSKPILQKQVVSIIKVILVLIDKFPVPLIEFTFQHLLPALFLTPAKRSFDLKDGLTSLLLNDILNASRLIILKDKALATFLTETYLPSLCIQPELTRQYFTLINQNEIDFKTMKNEFVLFYSKLQSLYDL